MHTQATSSQTLDALDTEHLLDGGTPTRSPPARNPSRLSAASLAAPLAVATPVASRAQPQGEPDLNCAWSGPGSGPDYLAYPGQSWGYVRADFMCCSHTPPQLLFLIPVLAYILLLLCPCS